MCLCVCLFVCVYSGDEGWISVYQVLLLKKYSATVSAWSVIFFLEYRSLHQERPFTALRDGRRALSAPRGEGTPDS